MNMDKILDKFLEIMGPLYMEIVEVLWTLLHLQTKMLECQAVTTPEIAPFITWANVVRYRFFELILGSSSN